MARRLDNDPDVLRCRVEREKRAGRPDPRVAAAKASYADQLAREAASKKGGRPVKKVRLKPMSVDPALTKRSKRA